MCVVGASLPCLHPTQGKHSWWDSGAVSYRWWGFTWGCLPGLQLWQVREAGADDHLRSVAHVYGVGFENSDCFVHRTLKDGVIKYMAMRPQGCLLLTPVFTQPPPRSPLCSFALLIHTLLWVCLSPLRLLSRIPPLSNYRVVLLLCILTAGAERPSLLSLLSTLPILTPVETLRAHQQLTGPRVWPQLSD